MFCFLGAYTEDVYFINQVSCFYMSYKNTEIIKSKSGIDSKLVTK